MKEALACNQCKGIICADIGDNERVMGSGDRWINFPENVADCPRRKVKVDAPAKRIFDQIPP
jgi:hypothetical protein